MPLHFVSSFLLFNVGITLQKSWPFSVKFYACIDYTIFIFCLYSISAYILLRYSSLLVSDYHGHMNPLCRFILVYAILLLMIDMI